jgi:hypothetical protein
VSLTPRLFFFKKKKKKNFSVIEWAIIYDFATFIKKTSDFARPRKKERKREREREKDAPVTTKIHSIVDEGPKK